MQIGRKDGEAGAILLWVMVVGLFAVGSLGAVMRLIPAGMQYSMQDSDTTYAFIAAESGIHYVMDRVRIEGPELLTSGWTASKEFEEEFGGKFSVVTDGEYVYITGEFGGATRTLRAKALTQKRGRPQPDIAFDFAVYALAGEGARHPAIKLRGSPHINGPMGTNATAPGSVSVDWSQTLGGNIYVGPVSPESASSVVSKPEWKTLEVDIIPHEPRDYPLPEFPAPFSDLPKKGDLIVQGYGGLVEVIDEPGHYNTIKVANGPNTIVFDTKGRDLYVRADTFEVSGNCEVRVIGGGRLFLYVDKSLKLADKYFNYQGKPMDAVIYYAGTTKLTLAGGFRFRGIIYVKEADLHVGGSFGPEAWLFSGGRNVLLDGHAIIGESGIIYAPKAHAIVTASGETGIIVANSVEISGAGKITQRSMNFDSLPLDIGQEIEEQVDTMQWHLCWRDCLTADTIDE